MDDWQYYCQIMTTIMSVVNDDDSSDNDIT